MHEYKGRKYQLESIGDYRDSFDICKSIMEGAEILEVRGNKGWSFLEMFNVKISDMRDFYAEDDLDDEVKAVDIERFINGYEVNIYQPSFLVNKNGEHYVIHVTAMWGFNLFKVNYMED